MTEIKATSSAGLGLFSIQDYKEGEKIICEASPFVRLSPVDDEQETILRQILPPSKKKKGLLKDALLTFLDTMDVPSSVPAKYSNKYKGMLQAAACFAEFSYPSCHATLLDLCRPNESDEVVSVAREVLKYIQNHSKGDSSLRTTDPEVLLKVMLVYTSNGFAGGRFYERSCRLNHSCNPNCIVMPDGDAQAIVAACDIQSGEELTISYLGLLLYADTSTRQSSLQLDKHFTCGCQRCTTGKDMAAAVPCPTCHAREGRYLEEDVAYDDDLVVKYCMPSGGNSSSKCDSCGNTATIDKDKNSPLSVVPLVSTKIINYLDNRSINVQDDHAIDDEIQDQLLELATLTLGAKHWTTNIMSLLQTDRILKEQHANMIQTGEPPLVEDLAQVIDALQRLERFVVSLDLHLHIGHVLSYSIIGVARSLVSLGDLKSKTYASKWIQKVKQYTIRFESEGMQRVVATLENAYLDGDDDIGDSNKKQRKN
jgi:hypothetical protein